MLTELRFYKQRINMRLQAQTRMYIGCIFLLFNIRMCISNHQTINIMANYYSIILQFTKMIVKNMLRTVYTCLHMTVTQI